MTETTIASAPSATSGYVATAWLPRAVILIPAREVQLGDALVDAFGGQLLVDELVHRKSQPHHEFAEHRTQLAEWPRRVVLERRRTIDYGTNWLRVARDIDQFGPQSGHHTRVRSHNPVRQGCYTHVDGWRAECSCGWPGETPQIHGGKQHARTAWRTHKADVITHQSCDHHPGYVLVASTETDHRLPPIPWAFVEHNGLALARLDELTLEAARPIAAAWADAFGVLVDEHPTMHGGDTVLTVEAIDADRKLAVIQGYFKADASGGSA